MLQSLHVKNLALIREIEVEFGEGLTILTGETGAGKSIILGSVNLALGGRYTKDIIREGADYALVELLFRPKSDTVIRKLNEMDVYPEDGLVSLSRRIMDGKSISRINGETVPMSRLKDAAGLLIDIHGQNEHQSLLYKKNHIKILDEFAGDLIGPEKAQVKAAFEVWKRCKKELEDAGMDEAERAKELSYLQFEVDEIDAAKLNPGEDEELEALYKRMSNGARMAEAVQGAYALTSQDEDSASENFSRAIRSLSEISDLDPRAGELYDQLSQLDDLLNDFNRDLSEYSDSLIYSEQELMETENRLNEINRLKVKYGNSIEEILAYQEERQKRIEQLNDYETYLADLKDKTDQAEKELKNHTDRLSRLRRDQAQILEEEIMAGLKDLNFADVNFRIQTQDASAYTADGRDDVEFLISLNPGQPLKPLANVASGGELSRIMLAIKAVMADRDDIETLIFDEIDTGISGRTAQKVSEKMAHIGKSRQVICITHLAQIASMADHHYLIEKEIETNDALTRIRLLDEDESVAELARILGGAKITDAVMKNAREMKELAGKEKEQL